MRAGRPLSAQLERIAAAHGHELEDVRVVADGAVAVLTGLVVDDVLVDGEPYELRFVTTQAYVNAPGGWLCFAGHTAPVDDG